jgi:hypothetical protein
MPFLTAPRQQLQKSLALNLDDDWFWRVDKVNRGEGAATEKQAGRSLRHK